ncbi:MAG: hypothetical protein QM695_16755 [Micropruina sp.]
MPAASSVDRIRRTLVLAGPALLLGACAPGSSVRLDDQARTLTESLATENERRFLAAFASSPGSQALGQRMFATLSKAPAVLTASTDRLRVCWGLPGEPQVCSEATASLVDGRIANLVAATSGTEWLGEPLGVRVSAALVVAAGTASNLSRWSRAAEAGVAALARVAPPRRHWAKPVVVVVPDALTGFATYAGQGAAQTAAVTVVPGLADSAGVRVVVNPTVAQKSADDRALITHEAVHAWMLSPRLTGTPGWLVEGIAEALTAQAHPQLAATNRRLARTAAAGGAPRGLPDVQQATPASYALAQVAVQAMVDQIGWPGVLDEAEARTYGGAGVADSTVLAWYRDAVARLR